MHTHACSHPFFDLRVNESRGPLWTTFTNFGVDCSSRFPFRARIDTHTDTQTPLITVLPALVSTYVYGVFTANIMPKSAAYCKSSKSIIQQISTKPLVGVNVLHQHIEMACLTPFTKIPRKMACIIKSFLMHYYIVMAKKNYIIREQFSLTEQQIACAPTVSLRKKRRT